MGTCSGLCLKVFEKCCLAEERPVIFGSFFSEMQTALWQICMVSSQYNCCSAFMTSETSSVDFTHLISISAFMQNASNER